jgi:hypothetical protein
MPGKNFFSRFAAETGYVPPKAKMAVVAIYQNVVKDYRLEDEKGVNHWKKEIIRNGGNVSVIPLHHAKMIIGKRFQEQSYYHDEKEEDAS